MRVTRPTLNTPAVTVSSQSRPRFGSRYASAPSVVNALDFHHLGETTRPQVMGIYGAIIGSRLWKSRSWNEFRENLTRDSLGWYNWLMAGPLMQSALVLYAVPRLFPPAKNFLLGQPEGKPTLLQKIRWTLLEPMKRWPITSYNQIAQRKAQLLERAASGALKGKLVESELKGLAHVFDRAMQIRSMLTAFGMGFSILCLGIVIPKINIAMTRANVRRQQDNRQQQALASGGRFAADATSIPPKQLPTTEPSASRRKPPHPATGYELTALRSSPDPFLAF